MTSTIQRLSTMVTSVPNAGHEFLVLSSDEVGIVLWVEPFRGYMNAALQKTEIGTAADE